MVDHVEPEQHAAGPRLGLERNPSGHSAFVGSVDNHRLTFVGLVGWPIVAIGCWFASSHKVGNVVGESILDFDFILVEISLEW